MTRLAPPVRLSVVMAAYDEEARIREAIDAVRAVPFDAHGIALELVVVDDGSRDATWRRIEEAGALVDRALRHETNRGKGAALRTGFAAATGDVVIVHDADLEYDPHEIPRVVQPIVDGRADAVIGTRFRGGGATRVLYYWHSVGNRLLTTLSNMATDLNLTDMECGSKAFRRACLDSIQLRQDRFGFEPEIVAKLALAGCRFYEVPVSYAGRTYAEGKKITWKDGLAAAWCIVRYGVLGRLAPRRRAAARGA